MKKIIHNQTMEYLADNNISCEYQSGFRKNKSTDACLLHMTNKILIDFDFFFDL